MGFVKFGRDDSFDPLAEEPRRHVFAVSAEKKKKPKKEKKPVKRG